MVKAVITPNGGEVVFQHDLACKRESRGGYTLTVSGEYSSLTGHDFQVETTKFGFDLPEYAHIDDPIKLRRSMQRSSFNLIMERRSKALDR